MTEERKKQLEQSAHSIRVDIIRAGYGAGSKGAHFGGCLSMAEILAVLYSNYFNYRLDDLENRDRVILSKGHAALGLYAVLHQKGFITTEELYSFEHDGSNFVAHSKRFLDKGLEFAGGSLSLGLAHAVGVAYACKLKSLKNRVYVILGDGELNEGLVWESLLFAAHKNLNNLTLIIDCNHLQACGSTNDIINTSPLKEKFESFGFKAEEVDGHSVESLDTSFANLSSEMPTAIIANTIKGKGVSFIEDKFKWHHGVLTQAKYAKALKELGITE